MRSHATTATAVLLLLTLVGCGSSDTGPSSSPSKAAKPREARSSAPASIRAEWGSKLETLTRDTDTSACVDSNTDVCADAVSAVTDVVWGLEDVIRGAGRAGEYPKVLGHIDVMTDASDVYIEDDCRDAVRVSNECWMNALVVLRAPSQLRVKLFSDEEGE